MPRHKKPEYVTAEEELRFSMSLRSSCASLRNYKPNGTLHVETSNGSQRRTMETLDTFDNVTDAARRIIEITLCRSAIAQDPLPR